MELEEGSLLIKKTKGLDPTLVDKLEPMSTAVSQMTPRFLCEEGFQDK